MFLFPTHPNLEIVPSPFGQGITMKKDGRGSLTWVLLSDQRYQVSPLWIRERRKHTLTCLGAGGWEDTDRANRNICPSREVYTNIPIVLAIVQFSFRAIEAGSHHLVLPLIIPPLTVAMRIVKRFLSALNFPPFSFSR